MRKIHPPPPSSPTTAGESKEDVNEEIYESYKELLERYCLAAASIEVRKNDEGFYLDGKLKDGLYVMGGYFDSDYVANEIEQGDFPFDGIDREGHWQVEFLLKNFRGDYEEPGYMELLVTKPCFMISFEDAEKQKDIFDTDSPLFDEPQPTPCASFSLEVVEKALCTFLTVQVANDKCDLYETPEVFATQFINSLKQK